MKRGAIIKRKINYLILTLLSFTLLLGGIYIKKDNNISSSKKEDSSVIVEKTKIQNKEENKDISLETPKGIYSLTETKTKVETKTKNKTKDIQEGYTKPRRTKIKVASRGTHTRNTQTSYSIPKNMDLIKRNKKDIKKKTKNKNSLFYIKDINMPKEHQEFLYEQCKKKGLNFKKVMALISLESSFNSKTISSTNDYGYMQINKINHKHLSKTLGTKNSPLDPYINITWGTYMLHDLYAQWEKQGIDSNVYDGQIFSELDKYVMSSYNKGVNGFKKHGMAKKYINIAEEKYKELFN